MQRVHLDDEQPDPNITLSQCRAPGPATEGRKCVMDGLAQRPAPGLPRPNSIATGLEKKNWYQLVQGVGVCGWKAFWGWMGEGRLEGGSSLGGNGIGGGNNCMPYPNSLSQALQQPGLLAFVPAD